MKRHVAGLKAPLETYIAAMIHDDFRIWINGHAKSPDMHLALFSDSLRADKGRAEYKGYHTAEEFDKAREKLLKRGG